jgi:hypothetical protein
MCDSTRLAQNNALALGPGIVGLLIQGIESGLVLAYFCWWLSARGHQRYFESTIVIFVTIVGLYVSPRLQVDLRSLIFEVHSLGYTLHLLGLDTYSNLGLPCVSSFSHFLTYF